jgi:hypothetical protein
MITHLSQLWADHWKIFLVLDEMVWPSLRVMALGLRLVPTWPAGLAKALAKALAIALACGASNAGSGPAPDAASFSALPFAMVEGWGKWPNPEMAIGKHTMAGWVFFGSLNIRNMPGNLHSSPLPVIFSLWAGSSWIHDQ